MARPQQLTEVETGSGPGTLTARYSSALPETADALRSAVDWLLARQDPAGWWTAELDTNVTMTAEHLFMLRFLGLDIEPIRAGATTHFMLKQKDDGSWPLYYGGPGDLSTTIEAYVALKLLGVDPSSEPMTKALRFIRRRGGISEARVFTKIWLALFGEYPWEGVPSMPPELIYFPKGVPLNLYDFACWARQTIAPLLIVTTQKPVRDLGFSVPELVVPGTEARTRRVPGSGPFWWLDKLLKLYEQSPRHPFRRRASKKVVDWIVDRQEADGCWGGIQPPWVYSLIALHLEGMGFDHPVMRRGLQGLDRFSINDEGGWRFQACMSPVWDTAWSLLALRWAGVPREHPAVRAAVEWLLNEQVEAIGDWQVKVPMKQCGGWSFEFDNDYYPDVDDTAAVVISLLASAEPQRIRGPVEKAVKWAIAMQSSNGGWGAFDKDNIRQIVYKLPFADFGALLDEPSEDVSAHVIEMLGAVGRSNADPAIARGLDYLAGTQKPWGSWYGRWGVNHIYGTWCVVSSLASLGALPERVQRATDWLLTVQNPDRGWGETCQSYEDERLAGVGNSTPSQTAWAVLSLQQAGRGEEPAALDGLRHLCERQMSGTWEQPEFTGTGFPGDFYIDYHMYRHVFPLMALAGPPRHDELKVRQ